jgi:LysR family glycine cleavage system transcriptional activator
VHVPSRPPSLRSIAAFEAAARHQSFAKAADELNLTQSAISHSVRGLEDRLGADLFDRRGRNVVLTQHGAWLAERMRLSLSLLTEALDGFEAEGESEALTIACPTSVAQRVLLPRWRGFQAQNPGVSLTVRGAADVGQVQAGEVDAAILYGVGGWPGVAAQLICREAVIAVAAPDSAAGDVGSPERTLIENSEFPWALWFSQLELRAPADPFVLTVSDWDLALHAARAGLGACLAREILVADDLRSGSLVRLGSQRIPADAGHYVVWRGGGPNGRLVERFLEWLCTEMREDGRAFTAPLAAAAGPPRLRAMGVGLGS